MPSCLFRYSAIQLPRWFGYTCFWASCCSSQTRTLSGARPSRGRAGAAIRPSARAAVRNWRIGVLKRSSTSTPKSGLLPIRPVDEHEGDDQEGDPGDPGDVDGPGGNVHPAEAVDEEAGRHLAGEGGDDHAHDADARGGDERGGDEDGADQAAEELPPGGLADREHAALPADEDDEGEDGRADREG